MNDYERGLFSSMFTQMSEGVKLTTQERTAASKKLQADPDDDDVLELVHFSATGIKLDRTSPSPSKSGVLSLSKPVSVIGQCR